MERLKNITDKKNRNVVGLMSGTSVDSIDVALVNIEGYRENIKTKLICFNTYPFSKDIRERIFRLFEEETSSNKDICHMNFLLGNLFSKAVIDLVNKSNLTLQDIDLIGSHGQTIYHNPNEVLDSGFKIKSTLQIGEGAVIAEKTGIITISDFRVSDMAAGGQGAPLVPYTEFLLYKSNDENIALQNIGGIGNITVIPKNANKENVIAFDTGPGNMIIDFMINKISDGKLKYDEGGDFARKGNINESFLNMLLEDSYFKLNIPKTTGREYFGKNYSENLFKQFKKEDLKDEDIIATVTAFTAKSIALSCEKFVPLKINKIIIGGGGAYNKTLVSMLQNYLKNVKVLTHEDLGYNSDAKEAVAFAILANEMIFGNANNLPSATGAKRKKVMGKINL